MSLKDYTRMQGIEMLTTGVCNATCKYCYIPKVSSLSKIHKEVIKCIRDNKYIDTFKEIYGDNLETLSFWGTEPTLTISEINLVIERFFENFPKLSNILFSSNFLTNIEHLLEFISILENIGKKYNKKITLDIQISLDGPEFITDNSRMKGATEKIIKNYITYLDYLTDHELKYLKIKSNFKPTFDISIIRQLLENNDRLIEYYKFFEFLHEQYVSREKLLKCNYFSITLAHSGTLMVPGKYTTEEGKIFGMYVNKLRNMMNYVNNSPVFKYYNKENIFGYVFSLKHLLEHSSELTKHCERFSCSGGNTNIAIDQSNSIHICHRSYYLNNDEYVNEVMSKTDINEWDVSEFNEKTINNLNKNLIVNMKDDKEVSRFIYTLNGFHSFYKFKISQLHTLLMLLADNGQVSPIYKENKDLALLLCIFLHFSFGCSIENAINSGSINLYNTSLLRIWANGAFEEMIKML